VVFTGLSPDALMLMLMLMLLLMLMLMLVPDAGA
jgi:hypothetical protein